MGGHYYPTRDMQERESVFVERRRDNNDRGGKRWYFSSSGKCEEEEEEYFFRRTGRFSWCGLSGGGGREIMNAEKPLLPLYIVDKIGWICGNLWWWKFLEPGGRRVKNMWDGGVKKGGGIWGLWNEKKRSRWWWWWPLWDGSRKRRGKREIMQQPCLWVFFPSSSSFSGQGFDEDDDGAVQSWKLAMHLCHPGNSMIF